MAAASERGYTLIELILAMAVFSLVLLIIAAGFLNIIKLHQNGLASRNTQQNGRFGMEEIIREARGASGVEIATNPTTQLCLYGGSQPVKFFIEPNDPDDPNRLRLVRQVSTASNPTDEDPVCGSLWTGEETFMSSRDVEVVSIEAERLVTGGRLSVKVTLNVASHAELLTDEQDACSPAANGPQFCAFTAITSTAALRGAGS